MSRCVVTITGPSGSGKSTLESRLESSGFSKVISTTTRSPREGEVDGVDYYFVSREKFSELVLNDQFAEMLEFAGNNNLYGVEVRELERVFALDKPAVVVCEPNGAAQLIDYGKANDVSVFSLFLTNDVRTLVCRFLERELQRREDVDVEDTSSRLVNLIQTEMNWVDYDFFDAMIENFDEESEVRVVEFVKSHVGAIALNSMKAS